MCHSTLSHGGSGSESWASAQSGCVPLEEVDSSLFFLCLSFTMITLTDGGWHTNVNRKHSQFVLSRDMTSTGNRNWVGGWLLHLHWDTRRLCNTGQRNVNEACRLPAFIWKHKELMQRIHPVDMLFSFTLFTMSKWLSVKKFKPDLSFFAHFLHSSAVPRHHILFSAAFHGSRWKLSSFVPLRFHFDVSSEHCQICPEDTQSCRDAVNSIFNICWLQWICFGSDHRDWTEKSKEKTH